MKAMPGFSLIEIVLATMIAAMLGVILFSAYSQSNKIARSIDDFVDVYSKEALLQYQFARDLSGAFIPDQAYDQEKPLQQIFVSNQQDKQLKSLTFITNNPMAVYSSAKPRIARVMYRLQEEKNMPAGIVSYSLMRQESSNLDINEFIGQDKKVREYEVADGIKQIQFSFSRKVKKEDAIEVETKDNWRSETEENKEKKENQKPTVIMPQLVTFTVMVWDNEKRRDRVFVGTVPIAAMMDVEVQEEQTEKNNKKPTENNKAQPLPETPKKEEPKGIEKMVQETTARPQESKSEIVLVMGQEKKPLRPRSPTLIEHLSKEDNNAPAA